METMYNINALFDIQVYLGYERVYTVEPKGKFGGLAVFWKSSMAVEILPIKIWLTWRFKLE